MFRGLIILLAFMFMVVGQAVFWGFLFFLALIVTIIVFTVIGGGKLIDEFNAKNNQRRKPP